MWLQISGEESLTADDLKALAQAGFDHVRLPVDPMKLGWQAATGAAGAFGRQPLLDEVVHRIIDAGLNLILDFHPDGASLGFLRTAGGEPAWVEAWGAWAGRYAAIPSDRLVFELMNEPSRVYGTDRGAWTRAQARAVERIRKSAPANWIMTTGTYDPLNYVRSLEPPADRRIVATAHCYWPYELTHMGASWDDAVTTGRRDVRNLRYPANLTAPDAPHVAPGGDPERVGRLVREYLAAGWDIEKIRPHIEDTAKWSHERGIPVHFTEFGVLRLYADPDSRLRWLSDVRSLLESYGIGWSLWDLSCTFGIIELDGTGPSHWHKLCPAHAGPIRVEPAVRTALGLRGA